MLGAASSLGGLSLVVTKPGLLKHKAMTSSLTLLASSSVILGTSEGGLKCGFMLHILNASWKSDSGVSLGGGGAAGVGATGNAGAAFLGGGLAPIGCDAWWLPHGLYELSVVFLLGGIAFPPACTGCKLSDSLGLLSGSGFIQGLSLVVEALSEANLSTLWRSWFPIIAKSVLCL